MLSQPGSSDATVKLYQPPPPPPPPPPPEDPPDEPDEDPGATDDEAMAESNELARLREKLERP